MATHWFHQFMGEELGPYTSTELKQKAAIGLIQKDSLVRKGPDGEWVSAFRVTRLFEQPAHSQPPTTIASNSDVQRTAGAPSDDVKKPLGTRPRSSWIFWTSVAIGVCTLLTTAVLIIARFSNGDSDAKDLTDSTILVRSINDLPRDQVQSKLDGMIASLTSRGLEIDESGFGLFRKVELRDKTLVVEFNGLLWNMRKHEYNHGDIMNLGNLWTSWAGADDVVIEAYDNAGNHIGHYGPDDIFAKGLDRTTGRMVRFESLPMQNSSVMSSEELDTMRESISSAMAEMNTANTELDKWAAAWPLAHHGSMSRSGVRQAETGAPVSLMLELASDPRTWSTCTATRKIIPGVDPETVKIEIASFVFNELPWKPTLDVFTKWLSAEIGEGESELMQWRLEDNSTANTQLLKLSFRLKSLE